MIAKNTAPNAIIGISTKAAGSICSPLGLGVENIKALWFEHNLTAIMHREQRKRILLTENANEIPAIPLFLGDHSGGVYLVSVGYRAKMRKVELPVPFDAGQ